MHDKYKINSYLSGGICGVTSWTVTYPIDTIKTRQAFHNISFIDACKQGSFWKGYLTCALRAFFVNSAGFYVYDKCNSSLS